MQQNVTDISYNIALTYPFSEQKSEPSISHGVNFISLLELSFYVLYHSMHLHKAFDVIYQTPERAFGWDIKHRRAPSVSA